MTLENSATMLLRWLAKSGGSSGLHYGDNRKEDQKVQWSEHCREYKPEILKPNTAPGDHVLWEILEDTVYLSHKKFTSEVGVSNADIHSAAVLLGQGWLYQVLLRSTAPAGNGEHNYQEWLSEWQPGIADPYRVMEMGNKT